MSGIALLAALFAAAEDTITHAELRAPGLVCTIGGNEALGEHRTGYNGVFDLRIPGEADSAFVPAYAGLNLEHYFDTRPRPSDREVFFEPRCAPMTFGRMTESSVELYQPPTPVYGVESWTRFEVGPSCIDMAFRCIPRKADLAGGVLGVFWASYINAPLDKSLYFLAAGSTLEKPVWVQYCTQEHGRDSTVRHESDSFDIPFAGGPGTLFDNLSPMRYSIPFYYGRVGRNVLIFIFKPGPVVRFSHSPSGGGATPTGDGHNPAWDFQMIVPNYRVNQEYRLDMRLVYKPWTDRGDVIAEVRKYLESR